MNGTAIDRQTDGDGSDTCGVILPDYGAIIKNARRDAITAEFYAEVAEAFGRAIEKFERLRRE